MCGLLYFRSADLRADDARVLSAMELLDIRGPDGRGVHWGQGFALGHTRLAIIDTSAAANQPFWDATRRYVIVYNGEIYNYAELRQRLIGEGVAMRTNSDTETLLEALIRYGWKRTLALVRGMFAFVMVDTKTGATMAVRDHFGQKPVYYSTHGGGLAVASDALSVCRLIGRREIRAQAYSVYLSAGGDHGTFGMVQPDRSFFDHVETLPAGHVLVAENGKVSVERYFAPVELYDRTRAATLNGQSLDASVDELRALYKQAARRHLVSDVPVGMLLSGGIDSSLVFWYATEQSDRLTCFTKISPGIEQIPLTVVPELLKRRPANAYFGVQSPASYLVELEQFIAASRSPSRWGGGPPMHNLCVDARRNGIVALLGGDCADEYFGGYEHYQAMFGKADESDYGDLVSLDRNAPFYNAQDAAPFEERQRAIRAEINAALGNDLAPDERYAQATLLHDTTSFLQNCNLPHSDAYSMATSVELRNPLLDIDMVGFALNLPNRLRGARHSSGQFGKVLMRELAGRDMGDFIQVRKEGTRNFAMKAAEQKYWRLDRFEIFAVLGLDWRAVAAKLGKRDMVRLFNLEIFHRKFFGAGNASALPQIMSAAGLAFAGIAA